MFCETTIPVNKILGTTAHTRDAAADVLQAAENHPCDYVELDFSEVEYISRSFADQFHADKLALAQRINKTIIVTNANDEVFNMLQAVAKTQRETNRNYQKVEVFKYSNIQSLQSFLLSF